jgi:hypothetical protein
VLDPRECHALARPRCTQCAGYGQVNARAGKRRACGCVWRRVFRSCLKRYKACAADRRTRLSIRGWNFSRPAAEYRADLELLARRSLDELELDIFRLHHLGGCDWTVCTRRLRMSKGNFFHAVYRIEEALGQACALTTPHPLYPSTRYFGLAEQSSGLETDRGGPVERWRYVLIGGRCRWDLYASNRMGKAD